VTARAVATVQAEGVTGQAVTPAVLALIEQLGIATELEAGLKPGFDLLIDCTGAAAGFKRAMELVRPRGTIVLKSTAAAASSLNLAPVVVKEITVVGSRCGRFGPALAALEAGRLDPRPLISAAYPLEDGLEAIAAAEHSNFKILLKVS
jgi:threonine dehydrogenase-like Zn-dependent dehydrogenase